MVKPHGPVIGVDLGGTKILVGAVDGQGRVDHLTRDLTHAAEGPEKVIARIAQLVGQVRARLGVEPTAISIGVPGAVDIVRGTVERAPNLGWQNVPLARELGRSFGAPIFLDNDVRVAVLGEHAYGAGRGTETMIGVWIGTGIGGGLVIKGELHLGARSVAGELGHAIVDPRGARCRCGNRGCIEALASRTAIERELWAAVKKGFRSDARRRMEKKGRTQLTSGVMARLLADGDPAMTRVVRRAQRALGLFTANLINALDPEVVVFGGGIVERMREEFVARIRKVAYQHVLSQRDLESVRVVATELCEAAPIAGAAYLARKRLAEMPAHRNAAGA